MDIYHLFSAVEWKKLTDFAFVLQEPEKNYEMVLKNWDLGAGLRLNVWDVETFYITFPDPKAAVMSERNIVVNAPLHWAYIVPTYYPIGISVLIKNRHVPWPKRVQDPQEPTEIKFQDQDPNGLTAR